MGYLYLIISLLTGATKGYCGKKTSGLITNNADAMSTNLLRMGLCSVIGFLLIFITGDARFIMCGGTTLLLSAMSGVSTTVFVISWLFSVKSGAFMLVEVMLILGVLVPIISGIFLFDNVVSINQWIGLAVLFLSVYIMSGYNRSIKGRMSIKNIAILVVCGLSSGVTDLSQKMFTYYSAGVPVSVFNFYTYVFSGIILSILLPVFNKREKRTIAIKNIMGYILVMSLCLFMNSFFRTLAAGYLDPVHLYPTANSISLVLATLMSRIMFKEKITIQAGIGILLAFAGIMLINIL